MSIYTAAAYPDCGTLANFKAWAMMFSAALTAFGWTQTADTGQVNWATIASVPTGTGTYEIWQSADTVSPTNQITLRFDYYNGSGKPTVTVSVGTSGTDGAGHLLGAKIGMTVNGYNNSTAATLNSYFSGDSGSFRCIVFATDGNTTYPLYYHPFGISIERSRNSSGAKTGDYVGMIGFTSSSATTCTMQLINRSAVGGIGPREGAQLNAAVPYSAAMSASGNAYVSPLFHNNGTPCNPGLDMLVTRIGVLSDGSVAPITMYGNSHNYYVYNGGSLNPSFIGGIYTAILIRYE
jgi:hypothetical protein